MIGLPYGDKIGSMLSRFYRIPKRNGQTVGQRQNCYNEIARRYADAR